MWDPGEYRRFGDERSRPFFDLLGRVGARAPEVVVDLGCGPGTLTATLARRWPQAEVRGALGEQGAGGHARLDRRPPARARAERGDTRRAGALD